MCYARHARAGTKQQTLQCATLATPEPAQNSTRRNIQRRKALTDDEGTEAAAPEEAAEGENTAEFNEEGENGVESNLLSELLAGAPERFMLNQSTCSGSGSGSGSGFAMCYARHARAGTKQQTLQCATLATPEPAQNSTRRNIQRRKALTDDEGTEAAAPEEAAEGENTAEFNEEGENGVESNLLSELLAGAPERFMLNQSTCSGSGSGSGSGFAMCYARHARAGTKQQTLQCATLATPEPAQNSTRRNIQRRKALTDDEGTEAAAPEEAAEGENTAEFNEEGENGVESNLLSELLAGAPERFMLNQSTCSGSGSGSGSGFAMCYARHARAGTKQQTLQCATLATPEPAQNSTRRNIQRRKALTDDEGTEAAAPEEAAEGENTAEFNEEGENGVESNLLSELLAGAPERFMLNQSTCSGSGSGSGSGFAMCYARHARAGTKQQTLQCATLATPEPAQNSTRRNIQRRKALTDDEGTEAAAPEEAAEGENTAEFNEEGENGVESNLLSELLAGAPERFMLNQSTCSGSGSGSGSGFAMCYARHARAGTKQQTLQCATLATPEPAQNSTRRNIQRRKALTDDEGTEAAAPEEAAEGENTAEFNEEGENGVESNLLSELLAGAPERFMLNQSTCSGSGSGSGSGFAMCYARHARAGTKQQTLQCATLATPEPAQNSTRRNIQRRKALTDDEGTEAAAPEEAAEGENTAEFNEEGENGVESNLLSELLAGAPERFMLNQSTCSGSGSGSGSGFAMCYARHARAGTKQQTLQCATLATPEPAQNSTRRNIQRRKALTDDEGTEAAAPEEAAEGENTAEFNEEGENGVESNLLSELLAGAPERFMLNQSTCSGSGSGSGSGFAMCYARHARAGTKQQTLQCATLATPEPAQNSTRRNIQRRKALTDDEGTEAAAPEEAAEGENTAEFNEEGENGVESNLLSELLAGAPERFMLNQSTCSGSGSGSGSGFAMCYARHARAGTKQQTLQCATLATPEPAQNSTRRNIQRRKALTDDEGTEAAAPEEAAEGENTAEFNEEGENGVESNLLSELLAGAPERFMLNQSTCSGSGSGSGSGFAMCYARHARAGTKQQTLQCATLATPEPAQNSTRRNIQRRKALTDDEGTEAAAPEEAAEGENTAEFNEEGENGVESNLLSELLAGAPERFMLNQSTCSGSGSGSGSGFAMCYARHARAGTKQQTLQCATLATPEPAQNSTRRNIQRRKALTDDEGTEAAAPEEAAEGENTAEFNEEGENGVESNLLSELLAGAPERFMLNQSTCSGSGSGSGSGFAMCYARHARAGTKQQTLQCATLATPEPAQNSTRRNIQRRKALTDDEGTEAAAPEEAAEGENTAEFNEEGENGVESNLLSELLAGAPERFMLNQSTCSGSGSGSGSGFAMCYARHARAGTKQQTLQCATLATPEPAQNSTRRNIQRRKALTDDEGTEAAAPEEAAEGENTAEFNEEGENGVESNLLSELLAGAPERFMLNQSTCSGSGSGSGSGFAMCYARHARAGTKQQTLQCATLATPEPAQNSTRRNIQRRKAQLLHKQQARAPPHHDGSGPDSEATMYGDPHKRKQKQKPVSTPTATPTNAATKAPTSAVAAAAAEAEAAEAAAAAQQQHNTRQT